MPEILAHLTLVQNFSPDGLQTGIAPSWSLTTELCFYVVLPLLAVAFLGSGRVAEPRLWRALMPALALAVLGVVGKIVTAALQAARPDMSVVDADFGSNGIAVLARSLFVLADNFAYGMVAVVLFVWMERGGLRRLTARRLWLVGAPAWFFSFAVALALTSTGSRFAGTAFAIAAGIFLLVVTEPAARGRESGFARRGPAPPAVRRQDLAQRLSLALPRDPAGRPARMGRLRQPDRHGRQRRGGARDHHDRAVVRDVLPRRGSGDAQQPATRERRERRRAVTEIRPLTGLRGLFRRLGRAGPLLDPGGPTVPPTRRARAPRVRRQPRRRHVLRPQRVHHRTYIYAARTATFSWAGARDFWRHRFARIYPVYALSLALFIVFVAVTQRLSDPPIPSVVIEPGSIVRNALFLQSLPDGIVINPPSWSLPGEVVAYALFPLLVLAVVRIRTASVAFGLAAVIAIAGASLIAVTYTDDFGYSLYECRGCGPAGRSRPAACSPAAGCCWVTWPVPAWDVVAALGFGRPVRRDHDG